MTTDDLAQLGRALYGDRWQSALARALGVGPRHMRKLAAGEATITPSLAADIQAVVQAAQGRALAPSIVVGRDPEGRRYVVRLDAPRFVARLATDAVQDPAGVPIGDAGLTMVDIVTLDAGVHTGLRDAVRQTADAVAAMGADAD